MTKTRSGPATSDAEAIDPAINRAYLAGEPEQVRILLDRARTTPARAASVYKTARTLVEAVRERQKDKAGLHAFLQQYDLSSNEGVVLMCLAESLLRIPDAGTADKLIADKLTSADWRTHLGESESLFVNASTWALMLTGDIIELGEEALKRPGEYLGRLAARVEEPVIRAALKAAMRIMARQFVMGRNIEEALERSTEPENRAYRYSFDMLGEAVLTRRDADGYAGAYSDAIRAIGARIDPDTPLYARPGISVKLSALFPRFEFRHRPRAIRDLAAQLTALTVQARHAGVALTVDAEEADRLEIMLAVFAQVYRSVELQGWPGLGLAVQAYQKRALPVIRWLNRLAGETGRSIPVRLVKGAYWDTEVKRAQELGLADYPVFTRKSNTDISYLACARTMLESCEHLYPQFATHNAHTVAYILRHARSRDFEFQRLHGMGSELYAAIAAHDGVDRPCRVYAPVGAHEDLLPYLVRRLLENGANTSFVNQIVRDDIDIDQIIADPIAATEEYPAQMRHPRIPVPADLFAPERINSHGVNLADDNELGPLLRAVTAAAAGYWSAAPLVNGELMHGRRVEINDPADAETRIGSIEYADAQAVRDAIGVAHAAFPGWSRVPAPDRAQILVRAAALVEQHRANLLALCVREAGKTLPDGLAEIREAVDFLRYYATLCSKQFAHPMDLPGPTGESNQMRLAGRGVFLCISPWNFPVAIFTGQIAAALAAGNTVLAKPAEQTSLTAALVTRLLHEAGVPHGVLNLLPGDGPEIGNTALPDPRIAGVAFTGSTETAQSINRMLAGRTGPLAALIAETGGLNAMIADSSALPEQLVLDAVQSAFNSAGQRCSALRVLFLQEEISGRVLELLAGYMDEMVVGNPMELGTDVGPVIDAESRAQLERHIESISGIGTILHRCRAPAGPARGHFVPPALVEISGLGQLHGEVFGPVLHVIRYRSTDLRHVIDDINGSGYGLTLGIQSRIADTAEYIRSRVRVGNVYLNRNMIGAVVGVQPFGGCGLSGTGPKAGGPHYLLRFASEQTYTVNTAAIGGNASLLTLSR